MNMKKYTFLLLGFLPFLFSCVDTRKAVLFNELNQASIQSKIENLEPVIQKNDLLSIIVTSRTPEASQIFNLPGTSSQVSNFTNATTAAPGYLVNQEGYIQFPVLGSIKAAGLTKKDLTDNITKSLIDGKLLLDPNVSIRYLNYKVTVIGEVAKPAVLNVPNEKITLLEALGLAGDMTIFARRDNVLVIRETDGVKNFTRLNLNSNEIFTSPYYYLKSNDIVYVEPTKQKVNQTNQSRLWIPVIFSGISAAVIIIDRIVN